MVTQNENGVNAKSTKPVRKGYVPKSDIDLIVVLESVSQSYATCGTMLPWISGPQAMQLAANYRAELEVRLTEGGRRQPITQDLKNAEALQNKHLSNLKGYLREAFGAENMKSHFAEIGLTKNSESYRFPVDKESRLQSLRKVVETLSTHGMITQAYGLAFWTDRYNDYAAIVSQARAKDSLVSSKVSAKNMLREEAELFLGAMVDFVNALYPREAQSKLREWGFQKEKY